MRIYQAAIKDLATTYQAIQALHGWDDEEGPADVQHHIDQIESEGYSIDSLPDRDDWLHETLDGHEWVIYTWKARLADLCSCRSLDELEEEMGAAPETPEQRAYASMLLDVREEASA